jgi:hypothetical protein
MRLRGAARGSGTWLSFCVERDDPDLAEPHDRPLAEMEPDGGFQEWAQGPGSGRERERAGNSSEFEFGMLEVADIGPPSSQESIVRASRCNRTNEGSLWAPVYGRSRYSYAYYHGRRRDCTSQPMLMRRELRSGALLDEESVELTLESGGAFAVPAARFHAEGTFEVRCANQSGRV